MDFDKKFHLFFFRVGSVSNSHSMRTKQISLVYIRIPFECATDVMTTESNTGPAGKDLFVLTCLSSFGKRLSIKPFEKAENSYKRGFVIIHYTLYCFPPLSVLKSKGASL